MQKVLEFEEVNEELSKLSTQERFKLFQDMQKEWQQFLNRIGCVDSGTLTRPTKEEAIAEAVRRMELLCFKPDEIASFKKNGKIRKIMENGQYVPIDETAQKHIRMLEEKGMLCYAAIRNETPYGRMTAYIIISGYKEEWPSEYENVKFCTLMSYVYNHDAPYLSEYGLISVTCLSNGILMRTY